MQSKAQHTFGDSAAHPSPGAERDWHGGGDRRVPVAAALRHKVEPARGGVSSSGPVLIVAPVHLIGHGLVELVRRACPHLHVTLLVAEASDADLWNTDARLLLVYHDGSSPLSAVATQRRAGRLPVLLLYPRDDVGAAVEALRLGFGGLFPLTEPADMLVAAIHTLLAGNPFGPPCLLQLCLSRQAIA